MSAQFAKDSVSFVTSTNFSASVPTVYAPANGGSVPGWLRSAVQWFEGTMQRRAAIEELAMLSDHELADIGLTRGEIPHLFDRTTLHSRGTPNAARA